MLLGNERGLDADNVVFVGSCGGGDKIMIGSGRNEDKVVRRGGKDLTVYIIPSVALDKEQKLAMVMDMIKINAFFGAFYSFMRDLKDVTSDAFFEHFLHLVSSIIYYNLKK